MSYLQSIILGILQGLTEFLPVSSSGHLVLGEQLFGIQSEGISFEVLLHLGSLMAVLIYFSKDIIAISLSCLKIFSKNKTSEDKKNINVGIYIIIATFVTGVIGILFKDYFTSLYDMPLIVAMLLSVTGLIIYFSDSIPSGDRPKHNIGYLRSMFIGLGQALAIVPGISRSGTTIAFSLFAGVKRDDAARFSFLLSIPAILGATVLEFKDISAFDMSQIKVFSAGAVAAFVSGLMVISLLLKLIRKKKLKYFSFYCWTVSITYLVFYFIGK